MSRRHVRFGIAALLVWLAHVAAAAPAAQGSERAQFQRAYQAMVAGRTTEAEQLAVGLELYPLYSYVRYQYLRTHLHRVASAEVRQFLIANEDSVIGERLRTQWLQHLARNQRWQEFLDAYRPQSDPQLRCTQLLARIRIGQLEGVEHDALPLWMVGRSQAKECDAAFERLYASPLLSAELIWQRIGLAMGEGETGIAAFLGRRLPAGERRWVQVWLSARADPARALRSPALAEDAPQARQIALYALDRLARRDLDRALALWQELRDRQAFGAADLGRAAVTLAVAGELEEHPRAIALLDAVPDAYVDDKVQNMRLRAGIRTRDWQQLVRWTEQEPVPGPEALRWRYWRARALQETGRQDEAVVLLRQLAGERDYYGFRAADRLGVDYAMRDHPIPFGPREQAQIAARPGLARARELYALGMIYDARREWHYEIGHMHPDDLPLAAAFAHQLGWHDRAILTLARSGASDDLALRFPIPFAELVSSYGTKRGVAPAIIYSIIKAESAFMADARSPVGALGLMQLMPATARETAHSIGMHLADASELYQPRTNITLGSAFLQRMLERYRGNLAMAAAAYNAGPARVRAWQPVTACQAAEDWIELIPFNETRRYVRQALFNTVIYEWRLALEVNSLDTRLTAIPARDGRKQGTC
ncbi:MAG: transglycosylase SLT domain-containing protein [Gammaproteobacteria bacterium]|nr:transglycosylase SLT domain-containing protein [Gammaproteobacteria bacterium]